MGVTTYRIVFTFLALAFLGAGVAMPVLALTPLPFVWCAALWPGIVYAIIAVLYFLPWSSNPHSFFCKDPNTGQVPWALRIFMAPFLLPMWTVWYLRHRLVLDRLENPYEEVADGIYVGRYPIDYANEFPKQVKHVVDLTCEFSSSSAVRQGRSYTNLPVLDCTVLSAEELVQCGHILSTWSGGMYIHCANGHGRSACLAAFVMVCRGMARDWKAAFGLIQQSRPLCHIHPGQARVMEAAQALLDEAEAGEEASAGEDTLATGTSKRIGPVRAASDGGIIEFKPGAPQDRPLVEHWKKKGVALTSRAELDRLRPAAATQSPEQGADSGHPVSSAVMQGGGTGRSTDQAAASLRSPLHSQRADPSPVGTEATEDEHTALAPGVTAGDSEDAGSEGKDPGDEG